jgi:hypothetical protein
MKKLMTDPRGRQAVRTLSQRIEYRLGRAAPGLIRNPKFNQEIAKIRAILSELLK